VASPFHTKTPLHKKRPLQRRCIFKGYKLKIRIFLSVFILLCVSNFTFATGWSNTWTQVTEVWVVNNGNIMVKAANMSNPETSCSDQSWLQVPSNNTAADRIYSTLLMALASKSEVQFFFSGGCIDNKPRIQHMKIH
jgi:hypothetical protein